MSTSIREHNLRAAALWGSGGRAYDRISRSISGGIEHCVDRLNPTRGEHIADVATGTGWTSRAVARLGAQVVGIDIAGPLLDAAREIALEQNVAIEYRHR
jgi:2-polyprenyl-3-methyl-5-hydroxy-6-metoxy-1,4-benzoquinol methylase